MLFEGRGEREEAMVSEEVVEGGALNSEEEAVDGSEVATILRSL